MNSKYFHVENWTPIAWCFNTDPGMWFPCDGDLPVATIDDAKQMMKEGKLLMANKRSGNGKKTFIVVKSKRPVVLSAWK